MSRRAIVTGGASGIGAALTARLRHEGFDVEVLDLVSGFDVADPLAWDEVASCDVACLNAGVLGGPPDLVELTLEEYRRALAVNVDGVVLGVRRLARVMPAGGRILCTASLAGLTPMPDDPIYTATKHAVVGLVRSTAPSLSRRGISINAICPGIADTPMLTGDARSRFAEAGFPLLDVAAVVEAAWAALTSAETGQAWVVQPGRPATPFRFANVPGARHPDGNPAGAPPALS